MGKLGVVALDSTRVKANASGDRVITEAGLRAERARKRRQVRKWERELAALETDENPGGVVADLERVQQRLAEIPGELQKLRKSGQKRMSRTDEDSRFLHSRDGFVLDYTAEAMVSEDGLIVAARVTQAANDHGSLVPLVEEVEQRSGQRPAKVLADAGTRSGIIRSGLGERRPALAGGGAHLSPGTQTGAPALALTDGTEAVRTT